MAGVPVSFAWTYFPDTRPAFPPRLTDALIAEAKLPGILGNCHASGMPILHELGIEHIRTGKPICYTSADSVFQIAAHETHFGLARLYEVCEIARKLCDPLNIGRVIARPFVGETAETFKRTPNRHDYAVPPPEPTILDRLTGAGRKVFSIGKIGDIFAHRGTGTILQGPNDMALVDRTIEAMGLAGDGDFVFANFVDFDTLYGHARDVAGYAAVRAICACSPPTTATIRPSGGRNIRASTRRSWVCGRGCPASRWVGERRWPISARQSRRTSASRREGTGRAFFCRVRPLHPLNQNEARAETRVF